MLFVDDGRRLLLSKGSANNRSEKIATECPKQHERVEKELLPFYKDDLRRQRLDILGKRLSGYTKRVELLTNDEDPDILDHLFYEYINENVPPLKPSWGYDDLKNLIVCINNAHDGLMKIITTVAWTGNQAKKIQANNGNGTLYPYEVQEALDLSPQLFRNMVKQRILKPTKEKGRYYKDSDINNLLKNALHQVTYPGVDFIHDLTFLLYQI